MPAPHPSVTRRFIDTPKSRIHVAICGTGEPVLLLHQTPRSWDEYRDVLPLLGQHCQAIAMDTVGFGDSGALPKEDNSIEAWAACAFDLLDAMGIGKFTLVGHHTGSVIAVEMAASRPERIKGMVLSACPMVDAARRARHSGKAVVDDVEPNPDGSHVLELWRIRQPFYPAGDIELLERFVIDALKAGPLAVGGHLAVGRYEMETSLPLITCPVLVIAPTADPHAYPSAGKVAAALKNATVVEAEGAMVPYPDQMPEHFAETVIGFLKRLA